MSISIATEEDFEWIYKFFNASKENRILLGATHPAELKKFIGRKEMLITDTHDAVCEIYYSPRNKYVSIYKILVREDRRNNHIATSFIDYIKNKYDCPIKTVCKKGTASESFWEKIGKKVADKTTYKGTELSVYMINDRKKFKKEDLF